MTTVRKFLAAAAVAGTLALSISAMTSATQQADGVVFGTTIGGATTNGQGNWPFGK